MAITLNLASAVALITLACLAALVVAILLAHQVLTRRDTQHARFQALWKPVIFQAICGPENAAPATTPAPALPSSQQWRFLQLWVHAQMSVQGPAQRRLGQLGRELGLRTAAVQGLHHRHPADRMVAMLAVGYLREADASAQLLAVLPRAQGRSRVFACRALLEADPDANAQAVVKALVDAAQLDLATVSALLKPFGAALAEALTRTLLEAWHAQAACAAPPGATPKADAAPGSVLRLLKLATALGLQLPMPVLAPALRAGQEPEVTAAALRLYQGDAGPGVVLAHAQHEAWPVRVQVARALKAVGDQGCIPALLGLLQDRQWWVRYRAAQSLVNLPAVALPPLRQTILGRGDRYALSMFDAVAAEHRATR